MTEMQRRAVDRGTRRRSGESERRAERAVIGPNGSSRASGPFPKASSKRMATSSLAHRASSGTCSRRHLQTFRGTAWCAPTAACRWEKRSSPGCGRKEPRCAVTVSISASPAGGGQGGSRPTGSPQSVTVARCSCTDRTALEPSPTAAATRFIEPLRTSPTANTPGDRRLERQRVARREPRTVRDRIRQANDR